MTLFHRQRSNGVLDGRNSHTPTIAWERAGRKNAQLTKEREVRDSQTKHPDGLRAATRTVSTSPNSISPTKLEEARVNPIEALTLSFEAAHASEVSRRYRAIARDAGRSSGWVGFRVLSGSEIRFSHRAIRWSPPPWQPTGSCRSGFTTKCRDVRSSALFVNRNWRKLCLKRTKSE